MLCVRFGQIYSIYSTIDILYMRFNNEEIRSIVGEEFEGTNIKDNPEHDWVDIVSVPQRPKDLESNLYMATYSKGEGGWDKGFDRRPVAEGVARDLEWYLAVEEGTPVGNGEYIKVKSLNNLARSLYEVARERSNPYIVGVTGSVGKTTTVAFLEHMLRCSGRNVTRFYSKRLTPVSVMCHYINRVEEDTSFVVMEYSAYEKTHVGELSRLLPPNISFLTNIYDTHLNPGMFESKQEIFYSKEQIKPSFGKGFVNGRVLKELGLERPANWDTFEVFVPEGLENDLLPPTLRTAEMYTVGSLLADQIGVDSSFVRQSYESFEPAEKRIILCTHNARKIFFQGETSGGGRLWSWFETTDGSVPWLFVESLDFADEDPEGFKTLLEKVFSSDRTIVLDTQENRDKLNVPARFLKAAGFGEAFVDARGYILYHKALSTRQEGFDPQGYLNKKW